MDDLISRQAAIDAMIEDKIQTKIYITSTAERDFEVFNSACDRHAKMLKELPSAQPEIIRCKDCKHKNVYRFPPKYDARDYCEKQGKVVDVADFCSWAERREEHI